MNSKIILLFDIDGTLLLTGGCGKLAFNKTFEQLFNESDTWQNMVPDGRTDISLIKECFHKRFERLPTNQEIDNISKTYFKYMEKELNKAQNFQLMPHADETLTLLHQSQKYLIGLATGNFETSAYQKLKRAKLDHHFSFGGFGCDSEDRQELTAAAKHKGTLLLDHPPAQTVVIGDTIHDINCGRGIGAITIGVPTGSTSVSTLQQSSPHHLISNLSELPNILENIE